MFGYYRNFIPNFAMLIQPLNELNKTDRNIYKSKLIITEWWPPGCQGAFDELKKYLNSAPILAHSRFNTSYILYRDASYEAFRAVLCQVWTAEDYPTPEPEEMLLVLIALVGEDWGLDCMSDRILCNGYNMTKEAESKSYNGCWNHSGATIYCRTYAGNRICLLEWRLL